MLLIFLFFLSQTIVSIKAYIQHTLIIVVVAVSYNPFTVSGCVSNECLPSRTCSILAKSIVQFKLHWWTQGGRREGLMAPHETFLFNFIRPCLSNILIPQLLHSVIFILNLIITISSSGCGHSTSCCCCCLSIFLFFIFVTPLILPLLFYFNTVHLYHYHLSQKISRISFVSHISTGYKLKTKKVHFKLISETMTELSNSGMTDPDVFQKKCPEYWWPLVSFRTLRSF